MNNQSIIDDVQITSDNYGKWQHFHNGYEILLVMGGTIKVSVNNKNYFCKKGSLLLFSNYEEHFTEIVSEPYIRYYAILKATVADQLINNTPLLRMLKNRPAEFSHCIDVSENLTRIEKLFSLIISEREEASYFSDELIAGYIKEILVIAFRTNKQQFLFMNKTVLPEIYEIQKYIDDHFTENIKINDFAKQYFININYLSCCFKELTGYSPKQYLLLKRMSMAKELLITTEIPINELTAECGFSDVNNFIRVFKREYNITPKKYRKLNSKKL